MEFNIPASKQMRIRAHIAAVRRTRTHVVSQIADCNAQIFVMMNRIRETLAQFNFEKDLAAQFMEDIHLGQQKLFDEQPEEWKGSERGVATHLWLEELNCVADLLRYDEVLVEPEPIKMHIGDAAQILESVYLEPDAP